MSCSCLISAQNLVDTLCSMDRRGDLKGREVFIFTDNSTAERAFHKGSSSSFKLFQLILRLKELEMKGSPVKLTNFYPYYIDTGLFEGFKPTMRWILPTLQADKVTRRMFQAIMQEAFESLAHCPL